MIFLYLDAAPPPVDVTIVEHRSSTDVAPLGPGASGQPSPDTVGDRPTPQQKWLPLRDPGGGIVLSYYWPVVQGRNSFYELTMSSPNVIDILPSEGHGSPEVRRYWTDRGKILLNRVYPFRPQRSEDEMFAYFAEAIRNADGISIDEVVAHTLDAERRWTMQRVLVRLRSAFPHKVIVVWDASRWNKESEHLLLAMRDNADAIALETYISEREADSAELSRFRRSLDRVESLAPGIREKILLAIGTTDRMRKPRDSRLADHLARQVQFIATNPQLCGIAGIAIYAPVYLSLQEQQALDVAVRTDITATRRLRSCEGSGQR